MSKKRGRYHDLSELLWARRANDFIDEKKRRLENSGREHSDAYMLGHLGCIVDDLLTVCDVDRLRVAVDALNALSIAEHEAGEEIKKFVSRIKWDGAIGSTDDGYYAQPDMQYGWRAGVGGRVVGFTQRGEDLDDLIERDRAITRVIERGSDIRRATPVVDDTGLLSDLDDDAKARVRADAADMKAQIAAAPLTLDEYQRGTRRTIDATAPSGALTTLALGLAGEAGEVCDLVKKIEHGHPVDGLKVCEELGDTLFYIAAVADRFGLSLSTVARENDRKLRKRYPDGFSTEASIARADVEDFEGDLIPGEEN